MLKKLFIHPTNHGLIQLFRYGMVVAIAAPIDLGGYIILKAHFNVYYVLAATISFTTSLIVNYLLSVAWVFTAKTGRQKYVDATIFAAIGIVGLGLTDIIVFVFTDLAHFNYIVSKLIAFTIVFCWSFGARRFIFHNRLRDVLPPKIAAMLSDRPIKPKTNGIV